MVAISTSSNAQQRAVSARHAVLEALIEQVRQQVEAQLPPLVQRWTQYLLDVTGVQPEAVQARLRAGNDLRQRQYGFFSIASRSVEQAVRADMAALAPLRGRQRAPAASPLSLVPYEEMDQQLVLAQLAKPYEMRHGVVLQSLNRGLARLFQRDSLRLAQNPFRPLVLLAAMGQAWREFAAADTPLPEWPALCQPERFLDLAGVLQALDDTLQQHLAQAAQRPQHTPSASDGAVELSVAPLPASAFAYQPPASGSLLAPALAAPSAAVSAQSELAAQLRQFFTEPAGQAGGPTGSAGTTVTATSSSQSLLAYLARHGGGRNVARGEAESKTDGDTEKDAAPAAAQILYLPQLKAGLPRGSLSRVEEGTIDLLAAVFESVFCDRNIAQEIRQLLLLLQLPVLKAALADANFFFEEQHPARKLLDLLSRLGWEQRVLPDPARLQAMRASVASVERGERHSADEVAAFARAVEELEATLAAQEQQDSARIAAPIASALKQEKAMVARRQAEAALAARLEHRPVLALVRDFLSQHWIEVLAFAYRVEDEKSGAIDHATCAMDELLWSVQPKLNLHERKRLLLKLPAILAALNKWLDLIQWHGEARSEFFAQLAEYHAAIVRAPLDLAAERQIELAISAVQGDIAQTPGAAPDLADGFAAALAIPISANVAALQRGMWLEFDQPDGSTQQVKLAWVSPLRSLYIFATASRQEAYSLPSDELAQRLDAGTVRVVADTAVVRGALQRALARAA